MQEKHRSGPLKQQNKAHKTGSHRSKGQVDAQNRGRVSVKGHHQSSKRSNKSGLSRIERKHQLNQIRAKKREESLMKKRSVGSAHFPPIETAIIPLNGTGSESGFADEILRMLMDSSPDNRITRAQNGGIHVGIQRFKQRFSFTKVNPDKIHEILDAAKICDSIIFTISVDQEISNEIEQILAAIFAQGINFEPIFVAADSDSSKDQKKKKNLLKNLNKRYKIDKIHSVKNPQEAVLMLRHLGSLKRSSRSGLKAKRSYMLAEKCEKVQEHNLLKVTGFIRGQKMRVNKLVHIPGVGSFQLDRIESAPDPHPISENRSGCGEMTDLEVKLLAKSDPGLQESLESENEPEMFDDEQYLSREDEENGANPDRYPEKKVFKVPKGTSQYQAAWIMDKEEIDDEESGEEDDDDDEVSNVHRMYSEISI